MRTSRDEWSELEALLDRALDMDESARAAFVSTVRADDPAIADDLESLLHASESTDGPLDGSVADLLGDDFYSGLADRAEGSFAEGYRVGAYRIVSVLGMGGMGRVFLAERADGQFEQRVALKVLRWDASGPDVVHRFKMERQLLASLDHPGIARLLDGGITDEGLPYLVMDWVDGVPIDRYCTEHAPGLADRIGLFLEVCAAVQYAHANLIVHRDIKPPNILVTEAGRTKLLDFGVAKLLDASAPAITYAEGAPLTPKYAAPEQVLGAPVTTVTDVYALGVLLHELLTGVRPHDADDPGPTEISRRIASDDPALPSLARTGSRGGGAEGRPPPAALKGDLDSVLLKALQRRPEDRYSSADQFADDLRRYLGNEPVLARDAGVPYRVRRFVRRHWIGVAATLAVMASLGTGAGVALSQARQAVAESQRARSEADRAERIATTLGSVFDVANPLQGGGGDITARDVLDQGVVSSYESFSDDPDLLASMLVILGRGYVRIGAYEEGGEHLSAAVSILEDGGDAATLSDAFSALGDMAVGRFEFAEADSLFRAALALTRSTRPSPSIQEGMLLAALATTQVSLQQPAEARLLNSQALGILTTLRPDHDPLVLKSRSTSARILREEGALDQAEALYVDVLRVQREHLDPLDPALPPTLNNLAFVRTRRGDWAGAEEAYRESLGILEATLGAGHPTTSLVRGNLASALDRAGRRTEAEAVLLRRLEVAKLESPAGEAGIENGLLGLTGAYLAWGDGLKAEKVVLERVGLSLPPDRVRDAFLDLDLAVALTLQGRHDEADALRVAAFDSIRAGGAMNLSGRNRLSWLAGVYERHEEPARAALHRAFLASVSPEAR